MPNIAVIGAGYWGKNLIRNINDLKALYGVCDFDEGKLRAASEAYPSIKTFNSYIEIMHDKNVDAVVIATPAVTHYTIAKEFLSSGKDVFVEKPLSINVEEAAELTKLAETKKKILMVGHLLEYHPGILKLKELIDEGELGKIHYIYSNRLNLGKFRREENILWSFAPHDISVMLTLLGEMPLSVSAQGGNYLHKNIADLTVSNIEFKNGVKGHIFVSWLHPYKEQKLIVVGDKKMAMFDDVAKENKLLLYNHKIEWVDRMPVSHTAVPKPVYFKEAEPLKEECRHFINCVKTRKRPKTDGNNGINVLKVLMACQKSLENNSCKVNINEDAGRDAGFYAHESAVVEEPSQIGDGTKIWHYSHIMKGAKIGNNCQIGQNVFIAKTAEIGNGVKIQNNVSVYDSVKLEDDVFCGPSCVFTNVFNPRSRIPRKNEYRQTLVKKGATIGANATIICGITIGKHAFIGAGAVVTKDVPDHALVYGNPASTKGWMCECGFKLDIKDKKGYCKTCKKTINLP